MILAGAAGRTKPKCGWCEGGARLLRGDDNQHDEGRGDLAHVLRRRRRGEVLPRFRDRRQRQPETPHRAANDDDLRARVADERRALLQDEELRARR